MLPRRSRRFSSGEGIAIRLNAKCISARKTAEHIIVGLDCAEPSREVNGTHLLLAVGRVPNTQDLGLDNAGIETDTAGYIKVDDYLRTNVPGIWALGDCNRRGAFTHTAYNDLRSWPPICSTMTRVKCPTAYRLRVIYRPSARPCGYDRS